MVPRGALEGAVFEHTHAAVPVDVDGEGQLNGGHAPVSVWGWALSVGLLVSLSLLHRSRQRL